MELLNTFTILVNQLIAFLPKVIFALLVLLIGILLAGGAGKTVKLLLRKTPINSIFEKLGITKLFQSIGFAVEISDVIGWLVKWFVIVVFLVAIADTLGLPQVSNFINQVALYIPNVIGAAIILIIGVIVANAVSEAVYKITESAKLASSSLVAAITKWVILIFTFLAALAQLNIATQFVEMLFAGLTAALALALGLAFGLGGKDKAKEVIEKIAKELEKRK